MGTDLRTFTTSCRRYPSAVLLVVQLAALLLYPFTENAEWGRTGLGVIGIVVLGVTLRMVQRTPFRTWIGVTLALPAIVLLGLQLFSDRPELLILSSALEAALYFYAAASLIAYMVDDRRASADELFASAGTFTLLAWAFAYLFLMVQALQPGSFTAAIDPQNPRTWTELMFLSFALLSSTGIGDVIPLTAASRGLAIIEMFAGVMYLALVVSRLIGMTLQREPRL